MQYVMQYKMQYNIRIFQSAARGNAARPAATQRTEVQRPVQRMRAHPPAQSRNGATRCASRADSGACAHVRVRARARARVLGPTSEVALAVPCGTTVPCTPDRVPRVCMRAFVRLRVCSCMCASCARARIDALARVYCARLLRAHPRAVEHKRRRVREQRARVRRLRQREPAQQQSRAWRL